MALKIRLRRMGRKKAPTYRIVVAESSMPRDGRFVANIGHYNPRTEPLTLVVDRDKARAWMAKGATPTDTVHSLFRKAGVFKDEPTVVETVVETVKKTAKRSAAAVKETAQAVAATVTETVEDAVETVRNAVAGDDNAASDEAAAEEPAADEAAADEPAADDAAKA